MTVDFEIQNNIIRRAKHYREKENQEEHQADIFAKYLNDLVLVCEKEKVHPPKKKFFSSKRWCPECNKQILVDIYWKYMMFTDARLFHYKCDCGYQYAEKHYSSF